MTAACFELPESGPCAAAATALVDCYRTETQTGAGYPNSCLASRRGTAFARCEGFGCAADFAQLRRQRPASLIAGAQEPCNSSDWLLSNTCNEDATGNKLLCDCALTGSLAPYGPTATLTGKCEGSLECNTTWGCCRALLMP